MANTPNLAIVQVATNQANKEVTINDGLTNLDKALTEATIVDIAEANYAMPLLTVQRNIVVGVTNTGTTKRTVTLPQTKRLYVFRNADDADVVAIARGTTTIDVAAGSWVLIYTDGTANGLASVAAGGGGGGGSFLDLTDTPSSYGTSGQAVIVNGTADGLIFGDVASAEIEVGFFVGGAPGNSELVGQLCAAGGFTLPVSLTGSVAYAGTAPTAAASLTLVRNGVSIGTVDFALGANTGTFTFTTERAFASGDRLGVIAQATADATLADISITLKGARS